MANKKKKKFGESFNEIAKKREKRKLVIRKKPCSQEKNDGVFCAEKWEIMEMEKTRRRQVYLSSKSQRADFSANLISCLQTISNS